MMQDGRTLNLEELDFLEKIVNSQDLEETLKEVFQNMSLHP
jgi:hypothetical protein